AFVVRQGQQEQLAGDIGITALGSFLVGFRQSGLQSRAELLLTFRPLYLGQIGDQAVKLIFQTGNGDARTSQQAASAGIGIGQQGDQYVGGFQIGVVFANSQALRIG